MNEDSIAAEIAKPTSSEDVANIVRDAAANQHKLKVRGIIPEGTPLDQHCRTVTLENMASVVDYPARDMTITVQAGMSMFALERILAEEQQQLPIDSFDRWTSVGAVVAGDISGPREFGYGTIRDYVIGVEAVDGQGRIFHAGGRVVKNVAGYDLCRLMVGSRGLLGIISQLTFKLKPLAAHSTLLTFQFSDVAKFTTALERLNTSAACPVVLDFSYSATSRAAGDSPATEPPMPYVLFIGVEGTEASCEWQAEQLRMECVGGEEVQYNGQPVRSLVELCRSSGHGWTEPMIRCLPSKVPAIAAGLASRGYSTVGHAGVGKLFAIEGPADENVRTACEEVVAEIGGVVIEWDKDHPGNLKDELSTRLRTALDPNCVFSP